MIKKKKVKESEPVKTTTKSGCPDCAVTGVKVKAMTELLKHLRDNVVSGNQTHVDAINKLI